MERLGSEIQNEVDSIREDRSGDGTVYYPSLMADSSSQSEEEEEERPTGARARDVRDRSSLNSDGFRRSSSSRIPVRQTRRAAALLDYYDQETYLRNRRISSSIGAAGGDSWRPLTIRERLDIRAGLRRETERARVRLARERDLSLRRMRFGELGTPGADRFPPLRELILRRLRGRNGAGDEEDDLLPPSTGSGSGNESRDRSRHREMLSWMVDQLTIDHEAGEAEQLESVSLPGPSGLGAVGDPPPRPGVGAGLPPRYPGPRHRDLGLGERDRHAAGDTSGGRRDDAGGEARAGRDMYVRAGERRLFRDYHFMHHGPSNIALTHR